jgi:hypothetical protein
MQSERYVIGSREWLAALHAFMVAARPRLQLSRDLALCEVYRNVPPSVAAGNGAVAFTTRFRKDSDEVEFELSESTDADFKLTIDYECVLPIARIVVDGDAERQAQLIRGLTEAVQSGRGSMEGAIPEELMTLPVHDQIARLSI